MEVILLQAQNPDKRQKIVVHHIDKDLLKEFGSKINLSELEPGWHELFIKDIASSLEFKKMDMAIGVIRIKEN